MKKKTIAFFDFDHTITKSDSFILFLKSVFSYFQLFKGLLILSPILIGYKLKFIPNWKTKEIALSYFFKGWCIEEFREKASFFSRTNLEKIIRPCAREKINWHLTNGHRVIIVSASLKAWLWNWADNNNLELISTEIDSENNLITGKLKTKNCWGPEKVERIKNIINLDEYDHIFAYGDSRGDHEMLEIADTKIYNWVELNHLS